MKNYLKKVNIDFRKLRKRVYNAAKDEQANAIIEYVMIFPLILLIICTIFIVSFALHDKSTLESAAQRGAIYGAHIIADPNYTTLVGDDVTSVVTDEDVLDINKSIDDLEFDKFNLNEFADNAGLYRAFHVNDSQVDSIVKAKVNNIVDNTKLHWLPDVNVNTDCKITNLIVYQTVDVTVTETYPLPRILEVLGLPSEYKFTANAKLTVNDPNEFVNNMDLAKDLLIKIDDKFAGGKLQDCIAKAQDKIGKFAEKISDFLT